MFSQKTFVTLQMVQQALFGSRNPDELNPIFFDNLQETSDKQKKRSSVQEFFQAFGLLKESQIGDLISQTRSSEEEQTIEQILQDEELDYYLDQSLGEEDFVHKEFKKFDIRVGHYESNQELKKLEKINRIIEKRLNNNCIKHYGNIAKGLKNIESLGDDNLVSLAKIQVIRNILQSAKNQVTSNSIKVIRLKKQSTNAKCILQKLLDIQSLVGQRFNQISQIVVKKDEFQFLKCDQVYKNLIEIKDLVSKYRDDQFKEIKAFKNIESMVQQKQKILAEIVIKNWILIHKQYDEQHLYNNLLSQFILEQKKEIVLLETLKSNILIQISDEIIQEAVQKFVLLENYDEENIIFVLNYIPKENFLPFLEEIFSKFTKLMVNYHYISRWFVKNDSNESNLILSTDWSQKLYDDPSVSPEQQVDIFLDYVQKNKIIYLQDRKMLWQTIEHKVRQIINNTYQINSFSETELITFLKLISDFIGTGIQYSNSESENIRQCVNLKIVSYYQYFIINFQKTIQKCLSEEKWEQVQQLNYNQILSDLNSIINSPLQREFINSIQYILPELKVENIESYSPINNARYIQQSTPNIRKSSLTHIDSNNPESSDTPHLLSSPEIQNKNKELNSSEFAVIQKTELKLQKCLSESAQNTPMRDSLTKKDNITTLDDQFINQIKFQSQSTIRMTQGIMNCLRLIKILWPVQLQIYEAMKEIIDYYIYSLFYLLCNKSFKEKFIRKFKLEHMNANNESLIETHENNMDFIMEQYLIQKKYQKSRDFIIQQYSKFGDNTIVIPQNYQNIDPNQKILDDQNQKRSFSLFEGLDFQLPEISQGEAYNNLLSSRIISNQSFLSLISLLEKIKPFLKIYLKKNADLIEEHFQIYEQIKFEFVEACYQSFIPNYTLSQLNMENILNNVKWDVKELSKDIKPNAYVANFKVFLQKNYECINKTFQEDQLEKKQALYKILVYYFFQSVIEIYSKIKQITTQSRGQLLVDIKQILLETEELLVWDTKQYKQYLENYLELLQFCNSDDIHTFIVKYRERYPYRCLKSLFILSEAGVTSSKKKKLENQMQMLKNYQLFLRDIK
ncbi:coiled-coil protein, putative (macronuclear) [Tetrahymena thermophila SB210]|uniref:Coiled-coil protein, putative n=1 Tax=Tetrahymena thermophila (strain SB210) TaxID=312017 RepID=Q22SB0_TETTS|nr:coiled-coil protein, putative [Tetrahymena thermophila SB210]EAR87862.2 coiled-coil protein, putative [Tetrahymena thermophila SB210]|eukprot:XP_001008107.2 coiled-coil protein, putative [Tetrahymena thermophila SB210]